VLYAGRVVESGPVRALFRRPRHPYTQGLLRAIPRLDHPARQTLATIPGQPPEPAQAGPGCAFAPRCASAIARCHDERPAVRPIGAGATVACHLANE
jgi:oligopeptide/dipeptide ABC transporter ATP-binding protein